VIEVVRKNKNMIIGKKGAHEFFNVLHQNVRDKGIEDIDLVLKKKVLSQIVNDNPFYKTMNLDLRCINRDEWLQSMLDIIISGINGESKRKINRQIAIGEFLLKKANACCGTPSQYCHAFWKKSGPLCGKKKYREFHCCPCQVCEIYDGYVIGLNCGLFMLYHNIIELILSRCTYSGFYEHETLGRPLLSYEDVISSIYEVVELEIQGKIPTLPAKAIFKDDRIIYLSFISSCAYLFVIAHELSHFLLGHVTQSPITSLNLEDETIEAFVWTGNQEKEFKADQLGFAMLLNPFYLTSDFMIMFAIAGAETMFLAFDLCETLAMLPTSKTHPPAKERISQLRQSYKFPERYYELSDAIVTMGKNIVDDIMEKWRL
jgi:hypothetical protein